MVGFLQSFLSPFKFKACLVIWVLFVGSSFKSMAYTEVTIRVVDKQKNGLPGVLVMISESKNKAITDLKGEVSFKLQAGQSYTIKGKLLGFEDTQKHIVVDNPTAMTVRLLMHESITELNEVVVGGTSQSQQVRQSPHKAEVIGMESIRTQPVVLTSILNRLPGVRIRQDGGVGSEANIMLNGIDGKGVKTFVDGVPVYLLGAGYSLNSISPGMIDRIEVYKGLIPVDFGSDALGGVINIVTRYGNTDLIDVGYTYGSWNTHKASINTRKQVGKRGKLFVTLDAFYNYSDNDYWMDDVDIVVDDLFNTEKGSARRFNDAFESYLGRVQFGARDLTWADELTLIYNNSVVERELQHGVRSDNPWGEPQSKQTTWNGSVSWKKQHAGDKWFATLMTGYTSDYLNLVDTARRAYYWDGSFEKRTFAGGETELYSNGTMPELRAKTLFTRESLSYFLSQKNTLNFTALLTRDELSVTNRVLTDEIQEQLREPQVLLKNYFGLALESDLLGSSLKNTASVKHFYSSAVGINYDNRGASDQIGTTSSLFGFGNALKSNVNADISIHLGYEYTVRQPDKDEIFGDYIRVGPNLELTPEQSHNINAGLELAPKGSKLSGGLSLFYRRTRDRIFLNAVARSFSRYENLLGSQAIGGEVHSTYHPIKGLTMAVNATYQNITLTENGTLNARLIGERVPNIPYLFGNGQIAYSRRTPWSGDSKISMAYDLNYINEFFPSWDEGINKANIPTQWVHTLNVSWTAPDEMWSLSLECRNLTDTKAYDNFSVQKPGRSFYIKTRIFLSK